MKEKSDKQTDEQTHYIVLHRLISVLMLATFSYSALTYELESSELTFTIHNRLHVCYTKQTRQTRRHTLSVNEDRDSTLVQMKAT